jgi:hypothetical protein
MRRPVPVKTRDSIVTLPDDVAVRTTNYHGTKIKQLLLAHI